MSKIFSFIIGCMVLTTVSYCSYHAYQDVSKWFKRKYRDRPIGLHIFKRRKTA